MQLTTTLSLLAVGVVGRIAFMRSHKFRFIVRMLLFLVCIAIASLAGILSSPVLYLLGKSFYANWLVGVIFYKAASTLCGITCSIQGAEHLQSKRPCVFLTNHQSLLDMLTLGSIFPSSTAVLAKSEIKWYPFMGQFLLLAGNIFINRTNRTSAIETMAHVAKLLKEKKLGLWMYPEGTRSQTKTKVLLPFKKGAFHLATQGNIPIVPIVCSTYYPCYSESEMRFEPGTIYIKILPPIETTDMTAADVDSLLESTQRLMQDTLETLDTIPTDTSLVPKTKCE
ncbi:hypothetical protein BASA50_002528 [Batrachochytrium salamandrivorans]|uniref:1-acyl-sn-glycerol-3-phosphate acyltransferase n=1 Tax=Batrachochytrium salamandrivorans TaxID=1357716 RepID=A0ABQ8FLA2_9FUNG|nr:hypothetical protein BASA62_009037 [Batrachochytrium salamandrivorans]KAH6578405.1 hypothetical protein BASA60_003643 [Batrachochytrium salamandrivorans]KAH6587733.1 hypothetical protein BASA61_006203 [Batrachochytrium salamandrivorans]KAH6600136.1 hypothetical protein BASA50_002528 [Batrachochytrium salamandrivorans]KAH9254759.1 hypothetical protein BASA81_007176 [Batrachochytrium salamandrivorans]